MFLTDHEVRQLSERGWSVRELAGRARVLLRHYGVPREPLRFAPPDGVRGTRATEPRRPKAELGWTPTRSRCAAQSRRVRARVERTCLSGSATPHDVGLWRRITSGATGRFTPWKFNWLANHKIIAAL